MATSFGHETGSSGSPEYQVLVHAVSSCSGLAVQQLLDQKRSLVHEKGWHGQTALHKACLSGDAAMVRLLLQYGADPNALNDHKETPIHYASKRGIPTLVHLLSLAGGQIDVKDKSGKTPIHNAAQTGSVYMLHYFEERGFGFKDVDDNLQSALHIVCSFGHLEAFKYLLRKGRSDPSQKDRDGNTALHLCVREGYAHGSWLLLNYQGLSALHIPNNNGHTVLDMMKQLESSKKEGHVLLRPLLAELGKLPQNSKLPTPTRTWYFNLLMPTIVYAAAIPLALSLFQHYQGLIFILALFIIIRIVMKSSHRLLHVSRWSNPIYAGTFCAGILHTMLVYYWQVQYYTPKPLFYLCVFFNIFQLYLYYRLMTVDPGVVKTGEVNEKTGRPLTLTDLCDKMTSLDLFCQDCEFVRTKVTKHCKLCDLCFYRMDHHCLFLLKCVAYNNHSRFVWFLIETAFVMAMFVFQAWYYAKAKFPDTSYSLLLINMFWEEGWLLSMVLLNIASIAWALSLVKYQLDVVARGQTTYFQHLSSTLTPVDKALNILYFLRGKRVYASDTEFAGSDFLTNPAKINKPYPVQQPYPVQNV